MTVPDEQLERVAHEWRCAREVISRALNQVMDQCSRGTRPSADEWAGVIIGRLAQHVPPILLNMEQEHVDH